MDNFDKVVKFSRHEKDLSTTAEMWIPETFEQRKHDVFENIKNKRGSYPSKNMIAFKEGVFQIREETTIDDLQVLAQQVKKMFKVDCFQATIDRETNQAHMLFDWSEHEEGKPIYLNHSDYIFLSIVILKVLDLPEPEGIDNWEHYHIIEERRENPYIFEDFMAELERLGMKNDFLRLARHIIAYIENMCDGREK